MMYRSVRVILMTAVGIPAIVVACVAAPMFESVSVESEWNPQLTTQSIDFQCQSGWSDIARVIPDCPCLKIELHSTGNAGTITIGRIGASRLKGKVCIEVRNGGTPLMLEYNIKRPRLSQSDMVTASLRPTPRADKRVARIDLRLLRVDADVEVVSQPENVRVSRLPGVSGTASFLVEEAAADLECIYMIQFAVKSGTNKQSVVAVVK